ncbi:HlyD family efflux transporter periplasmic adaptor subunit [Pleomorphomonas carboxyditropha]|nr:HlyD family efflux transporter periplasmic adaptor subunit [Pleomorphomonas carboxyditropha]
MNFSLAFEWWAVSAQTFREVLVLSRRSWCSMVPSYRRHRPPAAVPALQGGTHSSTGQVTSSEERILERQIAARDQLKHIDIRAPQDGIVHELAYHTVGGVIPPGETIAIIVPVADELIVNARIKPTDVDMVAPGQAARLRLTAFNSRRTPEVNARVGIVSADATVDPATRESYYLARIKIPAEELGRLTEPLLPGMPVEAYVTTSERTTLDYLLKPLTDQFARALREE